MFDSAQCSEEKLKMMGWEAQGLGDLRHSELFTEHFFEVGTFEHKQ